MGTVMNMGRISIEKSKLFKKDRFFYSKKC